MVRAFSKRERGNAVAALLVLGLGLVFPFAAAAESLLPLTTETAATLPKGQAEAILGAGYFEDLRFPPFTAPGALQDSHLIRGPQIAFRAAAGSWAEIQASFEVLTIDETTTDGETTKNTGAGDARLFTKVRVLREKGMRPALGVRFGTKLPNANAANRLGTDETDFHIQALASKDFGAVSTHANLGLLLLGNPGPTVGAPDRKASGQDDLLSYSVAVVSRPVAAPVCDRLSLRLFAGVDGTANSRYGNDRAAARFGFQALLGSLAVYSGMSAGLVTGSENFGVTGGLLYTFALDRLLGTAE